MDQIELSLGQDVPWPASPGGIAQIVELLRTNVRLHYRSQRGRPRFATTSARRVAELLVWQPLLLPASNRFGRAIRRPRNKTYALTGGKKTHA